MPSPPNLTSTSYVVLGLVAGCDGMTSYEMKQLVACSIGYFWPFPHSQLYAEPHRLVHAGLLTEETEPGGRRRTTYRITARGRRALADWLAVPSTEPTEIRDLGLLKLFFSAQAGPDQRAALADVQHKAHLERLREYQELREQVGPLATPEALATLEMGMRFEQLAVAFWAEQTDER